MPERARRSWGGLAATAGAVLLYTWSLLFSVNFEPLLIIGVLILLPLGLYFTSKTSSEPPVTEDPLTVRLTGPGKPGSPERRNWASAQIRRGRSIRKTVLAILIAALALFVENHVTGSIWYEPTEQETTAAERPVTRATPAPEESTAPEESPPAPEESPAPDASPAPEGSPEPEEPPTPEESPALEGSPTPEESPEPEADASPEASPAPEEDGALAWETQADRLGNGFKYTTKKGDDLAKIALARDIPPSLIGPENIAAVFVADDALARALDPDQPERLKGTRHTIEEISHALELTPIQVATRFPTTPLEEGQDLEIPTERRYDPRQWADWLLWTLAGLAAYLLTEVASNLRKAVNGEGDFLGESTWYWTQLAIGPLVAFVILLLFVHIDVDLLTGDETALEVNLHEYPSDLLIVPAFLLGFYSRVAREVLDQLMRKIFAAAWRATHGEFEILIKGQAGDDEISSSSSAVFETQPLVGAVWSATAGTVDPGGVFNPPQVTAPKQVFITAVAAGSSNRAVTKAVTVVKHKFKVVATGNSGFELHPGQTQALTIDPLPLPKEEESKITWNLIDPVPEGVVFEGNGLLTTGPTVTLVVPESLVPAPGETVTIKATYADLSRTIPFKVTPTTLSIQASANGTLLEQKAKITAETKVQFRATASDLKSEQLAQTKWKAEPADALTLDNVMGQEVVGKVKASGTVIAEHPQKGKVRFEITV